MFIAATPAFAADKFIVSVSKDHEIPQSWNSEVPTIGYGEFIVDKDTLTISGKILLINMSRDKLADAKTMGPAHFHNFPQGGPNFFVQHFPWNYEQRGEDLYMWFEDWMMEDPMVGTSAEFVIQELYDGNVYFGIHTKDQLCKDKNNNITACAAPATAIAGNVVSGE